MLVTAIVSMLGALCFLPSKAAELKQETISFYRNYLAELESDLASRSNFLRMDEVAGLRQKVRSGAIHLQERRARKEPPGGLIHHWEGAVFIPATTLRQVLDLVQNYDKHKDYYRPDVYDSGTLHRQGDEFRIRMMLLTRKIVTVAFETEHQVRYRRIDAHSVESASNSVKVAELENPLTAKQRELAPGKGKGYIWSMDSYWRFHEADGGVYVECNSVSLSRDIPLGMAKVIRPILEGFPESSLRNVLVKTKTAVVQSAKVAELLPQAP